MAIVNNRDVAIAWAMGQEAQGSNFRSVWREGEGLCLDSYSTCIGQIIEDGTIIVNRTRYSSTTSKHQSYMMSAIWQKGLNNKVIVCPQVYVQQGVVTLMGRYLQGETESTETHVRSLIEKYKKARRPDTAVRYLTEARQTLDNMEEFATRFGFTYTRPSLFNNFDTVTM